MRTFLPALVLAASLGVIGLPLLAQPPSGPAKKPAFAAKTAFDKATMEAYVRHLFLWGPQITVKIDDPKPAQVSGFREVTVTATAGQAMQQETFLVSQDGQKVIRGTVYRIATNPFQPEIEKLKTDSQPGFGAPDGKVTVVVFSDFQCGYCKEEAKVLRQNIATAYPNDVRVYFKDFPIDSIHPWARPASIAGRCIFRQNPAAFWDYHDWIFEKQGEMNPQNLKDKVLDFAKTKNLDTLLLGQCIDTKATEGDIEKSIAEARSVRVDSTPTLFINGRKIPGSVGWPQLRQVIDFELDYQKKAGHASEACCEVKLPTPLKN